MHLSIYDCFQVRDLMNVIYSIDIDEQNSNINLLSHHFIDHIKNKDKENCGVE